MYALKCLLWKLSLAKKVHCQCPKMTLQRHYNFNELCKQINIPPLPIFQYLWNVIKFGGKTSVEVKESSIWDLCPIIILAWVSLIIADNLLRLNRDHKL